MKKRSIAIFVIIIIVLMMAISFVACDPGDEKYVGTYTHEYQYYVRELGVSMTVTGKIIVYSNETVDFKDIYTDSYTIDRYNTVKPNTKEGTGFTLTKTEVETTTGKKYEVTISKKNSAGVVIESHTGYLYETETSIYIEAFDTTFYQ